jgi:hypothetical protein
MSGNATFFGQRAQAGAFAGVIRELSCGDPLR